MHNNTLGLGDKVNVCLWCQCCGTRLLRNVASKGCVEKVMNNPTSLDFIHSRI